MARNKTTKVESTAQTTTVESASPADAANTVINLQDLRNILVVFDLASARGAFKGTELEPVGQLYNKISKFVQAATPPVEESTTAASSTTVSA